MKQFLECKEESVWCGYSRCDVDSVSCICEALHYGKVIGVPFQVHLCALCVCNARAGIIYDEEILPS